MIVQPSSTVYALIRIQQRGTLLQQIIKRNVVLAGCSIYYFEHWSELLTKLLATPDERLPVLIALDVSSIRVDHLNGLSYLRNSKRLCAIPTLLLEANAQRSKIRSPLA